MECQGFCNGILTQRVHVPNDQVLAFWVIVIIVQVLGKYMIIGLLGTWTLRVMPLSPARPVSQQVKRCPLTQRWRGEETDKTLNFVRACGLCSLCWGTFGGVRKGIVQTFLVAELVFRNPEVILVSEGSEEDLPELPSNLFM